MLATPIQRPFMDESGNDKAWQDFLAELAKQAKYKGEFTTANRPTNSLLDGDWMMDTTIGKPIWYYSGGWIDATGASV